MEQQANAGQPAVLNIFNIGENQETMNAAMYRPEGGSRLFDPKLANDKDSITMVVRPVPYFFDIPKSLVTKKLYLLKDNLGWVSFDSMTTFNVPGDYKFCEPSDLWYKMSKSEDPAVKERAKQLSQQFRSYCWVVIVAYPKDPTLVGQIVPMPIPHEMTKTFEKMSKPSDQDLAIGIKPTQPFDIIGGKNLTIQITPNVVNGNLMRKWGITPDQQGSVLQLPLGPNNTMVPINTVEPASVEEYFKAAQDINLYEQYGYRTPSDDTKRRMKGILISLVYGVPGLQQVAEGYFPELAQVAQPDANVNPTFMAPVTGNPMAVTPQPIAGAPVPQPLPVAPTAAVEPAPTPVIQTPVEQPVAQPIMQTPVEQPVAQPIAAPVQVETPVVQAPVVTPPVVNVEQPVAQPVVVTPPVVETPVVQAAPVIATPVVEVSNVQPGNPETVAGIQIP